MHSANDMPIALRTQLTVMCQFPFFDDPPTRCCR
jgi:hypothetical protein